MVGDYVALVVAETPALAKDAAELIEVAYDPLPAITVTAEAREPGAARVWDDCSDNEGFYIELGDRQAAEAAFAKAAHVTEMRLLINRITANSIEPRGCIGQYDRFEKRYTLYTGLQNPHGIRQKLAEDVFHLPEMRFRVVSGDVGGSFGMKGATYPEYPLVLWASEILGRPVKWTGERAEGLMTDAHARDNVSEVALALDAEGGFLGLKVLIVAAMGAYLSDRTPLPMVVNLGTLAGVYTLPAIHVEVSAVYTNTQPISPYRGAGRPEAAYVIERVIDKAAAELGLERTEIRRRNMIPETAMPYETGLVYTYDCGAFERTMDAAMAAADWQGFEARRAEAAKRGKLRGIGIATSIGGAATLHLETAQIRFDPTGTATLMTGTMSHGQGHDTIFKQILSARLGLNTDSMRLVQGDTDQVTFGRGTFGSRSATIGGSAFVMAADKVIEKGKRIAAPVLEASETDIAFADGRFTIAGTDRSLEITEIARIAHDAARLPREIEAGLDEIATFFPETPNYPNGCHVCELEIDSETGAVETLAYHAVDDVGTVINPLLLVGQAQGGIAQGLGQALMEDLAYDPGTGQLLSGSFMDYCMPRADDLPMIEVATNPVPTATNPLGVKGAGEASTMAALPAVMNAVIDALKPLGIDHIDMPTTPERLWRAIRDAKG